MVRYRTVPYGTVPLPRPQTSLQRQIFIYGDSVFISIRGYVTQRVPLQELRATSA